MNTQTFAVCIQNSGYEASLELRKIYEVVGDDAARPLGMLRVIDESGEDYLFPEEFFAPIQLPASAAALFSHAA
ncbi:MAG: hypothetical protein ACTS5Y_12705 [Pollutimonas bauzanensis]